MNRVVRVKTLVVGAVFIGLVAAATVVTHFWYIPGALGAAMALAFVLGRWSTK